MKVNVIIWQKDFKIDKIFTTRRASEKYLKEKGYTKLRCYDFWTLADKPDKEYEIKQGLFFTIERHDLIRAKYGKAN